MSREVIGVTGVRGSGTGGGSTASARAAHTRRAPSAVCPFPCLVSVRQDGRTVGRWDGAVRACACRGSVVVVCCLALFFRFGRERVRLSDMMFFVLVMFPVMFPGRLTLRVTPLAFSYRVCG